MRKLTTILCLLVCSAVFAQYQYQQETQQHLPESEVFIRGDLDNDHQVCMTDSIILLHYLWTPDNRAAHGLQCQDAADLTDDGRIDLSDVLAGLMHTFQGMPIAAPTGTPGVDPTDDDLCYCAYNPDGFGFSH